MEANIPYFIKPGYYETLMYLVSLANRPSRRRARKS